mgnify:CR=1 FL=1
MERAEVKSAEEAHETPSPAPALTGVTKMVLAKRELDTMRVIEIKAKSFWRLERDDWNFMNKWLLRVRTCKRLTRLFIIQKKWHRRSFEFTIHESFVF